MCAFSLTSLRLSFLTRIWLLYFLGELLCVFFNFFGWCPQVAPLSPKLETEANSHRIQDVDIDRNNMGKGWPLHWAWQCDFNRPLCSFSQ